MQTQTMNAEQYSFWLCFFVNPANAGNFVELVSLA
jgi:hypothetical protein